MMATVASGLSGSKWRSMGLSWSSGSSRDSITNGTSFLWAGGPLSSPTAMPVMTAPVAERFIQLLTGVESSPRRARRARRGVGGGTVVGRRCGRAGRPRAGIGDRRARPFSGVEPLVVDRIRPRAGLHAVHGSARGRSARREMATGRPTAGPGAGVAGPRPEPPDRPGTVGFDRVLDRFHPPVEEYLETIFALEEEGIPVIQARLAERLGKAAPSVSEMLDRLEADDLIVRSPARSP